jgi:hypothetical protein
MKIKPPARTIAIINKAIVRRDGAKHCTVLILLLLYSVSDP